MRTSILPNATPSGAVSWRAALTFMPLTLMGFGLLYTLVGTGIDRALFPSQATGSVIFVDGTPRASALVAQPFADQRYFVARPSAAHYDPTALAASNQSRTNPQLRQRVEQAVGAVAQREHVAPAAVPSDLVTESGGGIDPDISPSAARLQVQRVAHARGLPVAQVEALVRSNTAGRTLGLLGEPRVNVIRLNLALDRLARSRTR